MFKSPVSTVGTNPDPPNTKLTEVSGCGGGGSVMYERIASSEYNIYIYKELILVAGSFAKINSGILKRYNLRIMR
jgi:hypothetical protein